MSARHFRAIREESAADSKATVRIFHQERAQGNTPCDGGTFQGLCDGGTFQGLGKLRDYFYRLEILPVVMTV